MKPTELLQEIWKMRFKAAYEGWNGGRLTQEEAARLLGGCERSFRRYTARFEAEGLDGLIDRRLEQASHRRAPVDEVMALTERYRDRHSGWNIKHFHIWYRRLLTPSQSDTITHCALVRDRSILSEWPHQIARLLVLRAQHIGES